MSRVAIFHDSFAQMGGAERVADVLADTLPGAALHTTLAAHRRLIPTLRQREIVTTWMQWLPKPERYYRHYFMLYPLAIETVNLRRYDVVLSNCFGYAKGIRTREDAVHVCYCHTPMRWVWRYEDYIARERLGPIKAKGLSTLVNLLRQWDERAARRPNFFIANSANGRNRIRECYGRESVVIHPPIDVDRFSPSSQPGSFYLLVARLSAYKRIDLAVRACNLLRRRLVVIGEGPDRVRLQQMAGPTVTFAGSVSDDEVARALSECRALLFPGEEDFGMAPLEANASGRPVIAWRGGGALETIREGETGLFFDESTPESLADAIERSERSTWSSAHMRVHARSFDRPVFMSRMRAFLRSVTPAFDWSHAPPGVQERVEAAFFQGSIELTSTSRRPLAIFVVHASDCVTDYMPHGDGLVAEAFIRHLALRGHRIHVATESVALRQPMPPGVTLHPASPSALRNRLAFMVHVRRLLRALRRTTSFDVIHQFNPVFTGMSLATVGLKHCVVLGPFVPYWPREEGVAASSWLGTRARDWISKLQQRHAHALLVTTPAALSRVNVTSVAGRPRIFEVPHGIDLDRFPARASVPGTPSILFLANLWKRKGIFNLLRAFALVRTTVPAARLTIAGRGSDEEMVRDVVAQHPDRDAITITGNVSRDDVPAMLRAHAVYCLPSSGEPFGMTILEAMASGVPIVTSRSGGPGFLVDEQGGRLVPPKDEPALARALIEILQSEDLQRSMGQHNRAEAVRRFSWDRVIDALEDAYYCTLASEPVGAQREIWTEPAVRVSTPRPPS